MSTRGQRMGNTLSKELSSFENLTTDEPALTLLATKLFRPPVTPNLEQRKRLITMLERNHQRPLTLISAPAGYGKTMLASQWLETSGRKGGWISLDEGDNNLFTFVSYLLASLQLSFPELAFQTQSLLRAPTLPQTPVLTRYLLNDLAHIQEPFLLALDDVHLLNEPAIFELLDEWLRHPPQAVHLVVISRHDPPLHIASLRARGQVTEIRTQDLRFSPKETAGVMGKMLGRQIDDAVAVEWTERTEGWITALRLVALSLRHRGQANNLTVTIQGDSHYLSDYLLAEVLGRLPPTKQAWILRIAILDRFCAPLCEAVCRNENDPSDLTGEKFINRLVSENLFVVPLDGKNQWFRFHHLFQKNLQEMLHAQLNSEEISILRRRASSWFADKGLLDETLKYALAAGDVQAAVKMVERQRYELMDTEQWHRLESWLNLLPPSAVAQSPQLICAKAYIAVYRGQDQEIISSLQHAEQLLADLAPGTEEHVIVQNELAVIYAVMDNMAGQPARSLSRAKSSLKLLPGQALHIRSIALAAKAVSLQMLGDLDRGVKAVRDALADNSWPGGLQAKTMHFLCIAFFQDGDLNSTLDSASTGLWIAEKLQVPETLSLCRYHLGIAHYLRNEFAQAEPPLQALLQDRATSAPHYLMQGSFSLALIYLAQSRTAEALNTIDMVEDHFRETDDSFALAFITAFRVELAIRQGKLLEAHQLNQNVVYELRPPIWFFYVPQLTPIKLLLAEGSVGSLAEARIRTENLDNDMRTINRKNVRLDVLNLLALICAAQGDGPAVNKYLRQALELGIVGGNIRSFVDLGKPMADLLLRFKDHKTNQELTGYLEAILRAFPKKNVTVSQSDPRTLKALFLEPLTTRENQVLRLLATDLSGDEISAELGISRATFYTHTKNIYRKLQVRNRAEAVQLYQKLDLI